MTELKPCPFCGREAEIVEAEKIAGFQLYQGYCFGCGARSVPMTSQEEVAEVWNRRTETVWRQIEKIEPHKEEKT